MMRVLGLVPARGGSKGVPRKNIRQLGGKPLLAYTAEAALGSKLLSRVVLTTDDQEIAEVGRRLGLDVPFMRPANLAQDSTPMLPVVQHAVAALEAEVEGAVPRYDAVCLLQPTAPFRTSDDIDGCLRLFEREEADCVISVLAVPSDHNPHWVYFRDDAGVLRIATGEATPIPRRQDLPPAFHREGSVYVSRRDLIMKQGTLFGPRLFGYPMDSRRGVNIDEMADWERAEQLLARQGGHR